MVSYIHIFIYTDTDAEKLSVSMILTYCTVLACSHDVVHTTNLAGA